jgi:hypothetical protein
MDYILDEPKSTQKPASAQPSGLQSRRSFRRKSSKNMRFTFGDDAQEQSVVFKLKELFDKDELMNNHLQSKINFFYKPYDRKAPAGIPHIPMQFGTDRVAGDSLNNSQCHGDNSQSNWKSLAKQILLGEEDDFRDFIKTVNTSYYSDLKKLGDTYLQSSIQKTDKGVYFPNKLESSNKRKSMRQNVRRQSNFLTEGFQMLKNVVPEFGNTQNL